MRIGLFPGQGVASKDVLASLPEGDPLVVAASELLGYDLRRKVRQACRPTSPVLPTDLAQPAIFVAGQIALRDAEGSFDAFFGHSLGEYTALAAGGAFSFKEGVRLVHERGVAMQRAAKLDPGGMVALLSLDGEAVAGICERTACLVANFNTPDQHVLSGSEEALADASRLAREAGGRAVLLPVSGPFHSPAMIPAAEQLGDALVQVSVRSPKTPVISGVTARPYRSPGEIRTLLLRQLTSPINFAQAIAWLISKGADEFRDLGPGRVVGDLTEKNRRAVHRREATVGA